MNWFRRVKTLKDAHIQCQCGTQLQDTHKPRGKDVIAGSCASIAWPVNTFNWFHGCSGISRRRLSFLGGKKLNHLIEVNEFIAHTSGETFDFTSSMLSRHLHFMLESELHNTHTHTQKHTHTHTLTHLHTLNSNLRTIICTRKLMLVFHVGWKFNSYFLSQRRQSVIICLYCSCSFDIIPECSWNWFELHKTLRFVGERKNPLQNHASTDIRFVRTNIDLCRLKTTTTINKHEWYI